MSDLNKQSPKSSKKEKKCWWIFNHKWSKWELFGFTWQRRKCIKCGYMQDEYI